MIDLALRLAGQVLTGNVRLNPMVFWFLAKYLGILFLYLFSFASIVFLGMKLGWI